MQRLQGCFRFLAHRRGALFFAPRCDGFDCRLPVGTQRFIFVRKAVQSLCAAQHHKQIRRRIGFEIICPGINIQRDLTGANRRWLRNDADSNRALHKADNTQRRCIHAVLPLHGVRIVLGECQRIAERQPFSLQVFARGMLHNALVRALRQPPLCQHKTVEQRFSVFIQQPVYTADIAFFVLCIQNKIGDHGALHRLRLAQSDDRLGILRGKAER